MKLRFLFACFGLVLIASSADAISKNKIALVNGTLIDPGTSKVVPNPLVVIEGDHISALSAIRVPRSPRKGRASLIAKASSFCPVTSTRMSISSNPATSTRGRMRST